jgi:hypothetical protein
LWILTDATVPEELAIIMRVNSTLGKYPGQSLFTFNANDVLNQL